MAPPVMCIGTSNESGVTEKCSFTSGEEVLYRFLNVLLSILVIFSVLTNAVVIYVFLSKKFGRVTIAKILYANMSLSDELGIITWIFQVTISHWELVPLWIQKLCRYSNPISILVSGYTMALIAVQRRQVIGNPLQYTSAQDKSKQKWILSTILIIWLAAIGVSLWLYPFIAFQPFDGSFFAKICEFINSRLGMSLVENLINLAITVAGPLVIGATFSLAASVIIYQSRHPGELSTMQWQHQQRSKVKSILMIMAVVFVFATFTSSANIFYAIERLRWADLEPFCAYNYYVHGTLNSMFLGAYALNPIIYWFLNDDFNRGFRSIIRSVFFCFGRKSNRSGKANETTPTKFNRTTSNTFNIRSISHRVDMEITQL